MITGGKLAPELITELWLVESLVDPLRVCPSPSFPPSPLLFVCSRSQTGLRAGPRGLTRSSLFDLPGLPFGSLENRGMKVNCKFL